MIYEEAEEIRSTILRAIEEERQYIIICQQCAVTEGARERLDFELIGCNTAILAAKNARLGNA